jgi:hypothetical protein
VQSRLVARRSKEAKGLLRRDGTVRLLITVRPVPATPRVAAGVADLQADRSDIATWPQQAFDLSRQNSELALHVAMLGFQGRHRVSMQLSLKNRLTLIRCYPITRKDGTIAHNGKNV